MKRFSFWSLRLRLLIIVILAMIPAIGLIQYNASEQRKLAISNAHEEAVRLARVAVYQHKNLIDDTRLLLTMLAQVPEVRSGSREQCNALMANLLTQYPHYVNLGVIGLDGYTICNAVDPKSWAYTGDRAWFKRAIKTKKFSIGDYIIGRITNRAILGCGYPILDQAGEVKSFVLASIDISWFNRLAAEAKMPEGATFMIIDRNRTILTYHSDPEKWVGKTLPESPLIKAILTQGEGVMEAPGLDGIARLYAFLPLGELPEGEVYVMIGIPKDYIMSPINRATTRNFILLLIIGLLAFLAVWISSNFFILHPTKKLLMTIQQLSAGNLSVRINPPYEKGELGQLGYAFDQMAELLAKRESERKQAEEEIRKLNVGLEQRVAERTVELEIAKEKAQEADRLKSTFLATMSHELRTPLNSIIGFTGILLQGLAGPLSDEQTKQLSMVRHSAHHLLNLINDVLDISKIEAGQVEIVSDTFNMNGTIDRVVRAVTPLAEKKGLAIFTEVTPEVGSITSDRRRVEQILINLLNNAIKFTEKGEVRVECQVRDGWLATRVVDTGIGIESEDMAKLFKPFEQIDTGLTRRHEGTGLGLSICKKLIGMLGGEILVESEGLGKGSTFTLKLPLNT